jgi:hypothetical protein
VKVADRWRLPFRSARDRGSALGLRGRSGDSTSGLGLSTGLTADDWPGDNQNSGYASASIRTGSSEPTAMGLPLSLTLLSLEVESSLPSANISPWSSVG